MRVRCVLGCCLLMLVSSSARSDSCSDMQAAIAKAAALRGAMQREAAPLLNMSQIPAHHDTACAAAQKLRDQIVTLAGLIDVKCLNEEQQKDLTASLDRNMKEASSNIGLFCQ